MRYGKTASFLQKHRHFFEGNPAFTRQYQVALEAHWHQKPTQTIRAISDGLQASQGKKETQFPFYRLWMEQSVQRGDQESLRDLLQHFLEASVAEGDPTWAALRGWIHLELEEIHAAMMLAPFVQAHLGNPYCLEFIHRFYNGVTSGYRPFALTGAVMSPDYFHWTPILQESWSAGDEGLAEALASWFPHSPLACFARIQCDLATPSSPRVLFAKTTQSLEALKKRYPENGVLARCAESWQALHGKGTERFLSEQKTDWIQQPELHQLLQGFVAAGGLRQGRGAEQGEWLASLNLPSPPSVEEGENLVAAKQQSWLCLLSPQKFYDWMTEARAFPVEVAAASGMQARDTICWALAPQAEVASFRLGGLWEVVSGPKFHPIWKQSVSVRPLEALSHSVPLELSVPLEEAKEVLDFDPVSYLKLEEIQFISLLEQMAQWQEARQAPVLLQPVRKMAYAGAKSRR